MIRPYDALITDYRYHLTSGRCRNPEMIREEIARLDDLAERILADRRMADRVLADGGSADGGLE